MRCRACKHLGRAAEVELLFFEGECTTGGGVGVGTKPLPCRSGVHEGNRIGVWAVCPYGHKYLGRIYQHCEPCGFTPAWAKETRT